MIPPPPPAIVFHVRQLKVDRFLWALAAVESGNDWNKIGEKGERTCWQIRRMVWNQHSNGVPFEKSVDPNFRSYARAIAERHVGWICTVLASKNLAITPEYVATVWRFGIQRGCRFIRQHRIPDSSQRVRNLYDDR